jgi:hypothetical protein
MESIQKKISINKDLKNILIVILKAQIKTGITFQKLLGEPLRVIIGCNTIATDRDLRRPLSSQNDTGCKTSLVL